MPRHLRVEYPGAIYHVTCRMIGDVRLDGSRLFTDDREREYLLERLGDRVKAYNIRLYQFVLMTNHFHLVFETPEGNCSRFMQSLLASYTVYYNRRHDRHGHLLDGRFKAKLVEGDDYLLALTRYVHLNPVKVGGMKDRPLEERIAYLRGYAWSTYPGYIKARRRFDFVSYAPILAEMSGRRREWPGRYREYVETGLAKDDTEFEKAMKESPRSIGGEEFRKWVDELYDKLVEDRESREDVSFRHVSAPLDPQVVLEIVAGELGVKREELCRRRRSSCLRAVAARYLIQYAGQTQRQVAVLLQAGSGSAISKQISMHKADLEDRKLARKLSRVDRRLAEAKRNSHENTANS